MLVYDKNERSIPIFPELIFLGDTPIKLLYKGDIKLYDNSSITHPLVEHFMTDPTFKMYDLDNYVAGVKYKLPKIQISGNEYTPESGNYLIGLYCRTNDFSDYGTSSTAITNGGTSTRPYLFSNRTLVPVKDGIIYSNIEYSTTYTTTFIYTINPANLTYKPVAYPMLWLALHPDQDPRVGNSAVLGVDIDENGKVIPNHNKNMTYVNKPISARPMIANSDGTLSAGFIINAYIYYEPALDLTGATSNLVICHGIPSDSDMYRTQLEESNPKILNTFGKTLTIFEGNNECLYALIKLDSEKTIAKVYNLIPGVTYSCKLDGVIQNLMNFSMGGNKRIIALPEDLGEVTDNADLPSNVSISDYTEGHSIRIYNIRDIGGAYGNVKIVYNKLFRGSMLCQNNLYNRISDKNLEYLKKLVNAQIELRDTKYNPNSESKRDSAIITTGPRVLEYLSCNLFGLGSWTLPYGGSSQSRALYLSLHHLAEYLRDPQTYKGIYYNCIAGADRTGFFTFIILGLCGVSEELLYKEYELTSLSGAGYTRYYDVNYCDGAACPKTFVQNLKNRYGSDINLQLLLETWLKEAIVNDKSTPCGIGLDPDDIRDIQEALIVN